MKQHKWHKEIKAWAEGQEVQARYSDRKNHSDDWDTISFDSVEISDWNDNDFEFRIKPQPKESQCKKHKDAPHGFCRDASMSEDRYVCECEFWEEPKEPQYLYAYKDYVRDDGSTTSKITISSTRLYNENYIGKIKLEEEDE